MGIGLDYGGCGSDALHSDDVRRIVNAFPV
jgi:hypothetical protein